MLALWIMRISLFEYDLQFSHIYIIIYLSFLHRLQSQVSERKESEQKLKGDIEDLKTQ